MYSWWWDSHICPKNSKWLQENLADMDGKIEAMIRIIEENADSFAQRAELFYGRRPELMKILEQFYRAYRALAERYDHAAGTLWQAHRKMSEAFPNQFHFDFADELPAGSLAADTVQSCSDSSPEIFDPEGYSFDDVLKADATNSNESESSSTSRKGTENEHLLLEKEIQELKEQIMFEVERSNKAETELQSLKEIFSAVNSEKEDALCRHQESIIRVSYLEKDLCDKQNDLDKLKNEVPAVTRQLYNTEGQKLELEKANQSLVLELQILKQRTIEQQEEIDEKIQGMVKLNSYLEETQKQSRKAETEFQSLQKECSDCEEQMGLLTLNLHCATENLKEVEQMNANMKQEQEKIKEENARLQGEKLAFVLKIVSLQDEVILLTNLTGKLEDEVGNYEKQNKALHLELAHLKEDRNNVEQRYYTLTEEIRTVSVNIESLQVMMKDLSEQKFELKEFFNSREKDDFPQYQSPKNVQTMSDKREAVENALSFANDELERLKEKVQTLEKSCQLNGGVCIHEAEKLLLISQAESVNRNMEELSKKNICLLNSLSNMNVELDVLRKKLKTLEETPDTFHDQKSILLSEKSSLVSQVNNLHQKLNDLQKTCSELDDKNLLLEEEKDSMLHQVTELQELLQEQKEDHNCHMKSSKNKLHRFEEKIRQLQETCQQKDRELESVQHKLMNAQIEIFILQRYLNDMKEENILISADRHKHQETLSSVQKEFLLQETKIQSLTLDNEKLGEWTRHLAQLLRIDQVFVTSSTIENELLMQLILREIKHLQCTIPVLQDEKQHLLLEKSTMLSLLEQFGVNCADLRSERDAVTRVSKLSSEELMLMQCRNNEVSEMNEKLKEEIRACKERELQLKSEVDILFGQITKMQDAHLTLQVKTSKLYKENYYMSRKLHEMNVIKRILENENKNIVEEIVALDCLSVICRSVCAERGLELQLITEERNCLVDAKTKLELESQSFNDKRITLEAENEYMKELVRNMDECRRNLLHAQDDIKIGRNVCEQLNVQIFACQNSLMNEKDIGLLQGNLNMQKMRDMNSDLSRLPKLKLCKNEANVVRVAEDENISTLTEDYSSEENEISSINQADSTRRDWHNRSQQHLEDQRFREKTFIPAQRGTNEMKSFDAETTSLFNDIQHVATNAALFKDNVLELTNACKNLETSMAYQKILEDDTIARNSTLVELKEKIETLETENRGLRMAMNAHLRLIGSLCDDVAVLEEHTFSFARRRSSANITEIEVNPFLHGKEYHDVSEDHHAVATSGLSKLQDVRSKVKLLQKVMIDAETHLALERLDSNASLDAAWAEIEGLKSKETLGIEISKAHDERTRDIQLDIILNPFRYRNGKGCVDADKNTDKELELWGKAEGAQSKQKQKSPIVTSDYDSEEEYLLKEVKQGNYPISELVAEELSIDKLEVLSKFDSYQECRSTRSRLTSDAQKLLILQNRIQELQKNTESSKKFKYPPRLELDTVKLHLEDAETTIAKLISLNSKLLKKVEDLPECDDYNEKEGTDKNSRIRKLVFNRAQKLSDKIARFELELQKIHNTLLKVNDDSSDRRTKFFEKGIILRDFIYGRRDGRRQKKGNGGFGCMRPRTKGD